ncbi:L,D-transpeptidase [Microbacterium lacus]|uniref:L,D-transpeptidase n=1 Tax=Microbacterium lacus TaxID=415217 RepID=UPI00384BD808
MSIEPQPAPSVWRARLWWIGGALAAGAVAGLVIAWMLQSSDTPASAPSSTQTATPTVTQTSTPAPTPTETGFPVNTASYDTGGMPEVNVFAVVAPLPVDAATAEPFTGELASPIGAAAPVWADPTGEPVAYLPSQYQHGGTTVPVIERQEHWVHVLLPGRQAVPSQGNPAQVTGWMRVADVALTGTPTVVEVSISGRTVDIVESGVSNRIATDFAWGTEQTPTPVGRTFIMTTAVVPEYGYTRGYPIVYLGVQSPTLDGFGGASVAVTAFHYHDARSGAVSNGCLRLDESAIEALAALPMGTPVIVRP